MANINSNNDTITQYQTQVGSANNRLTGVGPGTAEQPLVSQGASSNPAFQVLNPAGGGTGQSSLTANNVLIGNGTSAVAFAAPSSSGYVLTDNGVGFDPTFQALPGSGEGFTQVVTQVFTANGTYTPTSNMTWCVIEAVGGGGAGGGAAATAAGQYSCGGGGGGGAYVRGVYDAATIGASQAITIGAGGTGNSGAAGSNGSSTIVGALIEAKGGNGGNASTASTTPFAASAEGITGSTGGDFQCKGFRSALAIGDSATNIIFGGRGANSIFGSGGTGTIGVSSGGGSVGTGYGAGGGGGMNKASQAATTGASGSSGIVVITEYIAGGFSSNVVEGIVDGSGNSVTPTAGFITLVDGNNISSLSGSASHVTLSVTGTTQYALQVGSAAGALSSLSLGSSGQTLMSQGAGSNPIWKSLYGGYLWNQVLGTSSGLTNLNAYVSDNIALTTFTLPATAAFGESFMIVGAGSGGWTIAQNAGQIIIANGTESTPGATGSVSSTNRYDTIELVCIVANTVFKSILTSGNLTVV